MPPARAQAPLLLACCALRAYAARSCVRSTSPSNSSSCSRRPSTSLSRAAWAAPHARTRDRRRKHISLYLRICVRAQACVPARARVRMFRRCVLGHMGACREGRLAEAMRDTGVAQQHAPWPLSAPPSAPPPPPLAAAAPAAAAARAARPVGAPCRTHRSLWAPRLRQRCGRTCVRQHQHQRRRCQQQPAMPGEVNPKRGRRAGVGWGEYSKSGSGEVGRDARQSGLWCCARRHGGSLPAADRDPELVLVMSWSEDTHNCVSQLAWVHSGQTNGCVPVSTCRLQGRGVCVGHPQGLHASPLGQCIAYLRALAVCDGIHTRCMAAQMNAGTAADACNPAHGTYTYLRDGSAGSAGLSLRRRAVLQPARNATCRCFY